MPGRFAIYQYLGCKACHSNRMTTFVFQCPNKGMKVQGWTVEDTPDGDSVYASIQCTACRQIHYVNPATGKVLGSAMLNRLSETR